MICTMSVYIRGRDSRVATLEIPDRETLMQMAGIVKRKDEDSFYGSITGPDIAGRYYAIPMSSVDYVMFEDIPEEWLEE